MEGKTVYGLALDRKMDFYEDKEQAISTAYALYRLSGEKKKAIVYELVVKNVYGFPGEGER